MSDMSDKFEGGGERLVDAVPISRSRYRAALDPFRIREDSKLRSNSFSMILRPIRCER